MRTIFLGIFFVIFCTSLHGDRSEFLDDRLENALLWMFDKGIPMYYSNVPSVEIRDLFRNETSTGMYRRPFSNEPYFILNFVLWDVGVSKITNNRSDGYYHVTCYLIDTQKDVVEYWVIKRSDRDFVFTKCRFIITSADTVVSSRRIIIDTDEFIDSVDVSGRTIRFPKDDLRILVSLEARRWPRSFSNTNLANYKVRYRRNGELYLKKVGRLERILFNLKYGIK